MIEITSFQFSSLKFFPHNLPRFLHVLVMKIKTVVAERATSLSAYKVRFCYVSCHAQKNVKIQGNL